MSNDRLVLLACTPHQSPLRAVAGGQPQDIVHGPYGHRRETPGLPGSGFNGQWREPETGWYLLGNGYRAYNPVLMRFNSPDSLSPFGRGGLNAYGYCLGDPINRLDPDGHAPGFFVLLRRLFGRSPRQRIKRGSGDSSNGFLLGASYAEQRGAASSRQNRGGSTASAIHPDPPLALVSQAPGQSSARPPRVSQGLSDTNKDRLRHEGRSGIEQSILADEGLLPGGSKMQVSPGRAARNESNSPTHTHLPAETRRLVELRESFETPWDPSEVWQKSDPMDEWLKQRSIALIRR